MIFPFSQAKDVLLQYKDFILTTPKEFNTWVVLRKAPPLPFLPESVHGKEVLVAAIFVENNFQKGEELIDKLRSFGEPVGEHIGN